MDEGNRTSSKLCPGLARRTAAGLGTAAATPNGTTELRHRMRGQGTPRRPLLTACRCGRHGAGARRSRIATTSDASRGAPTQAGTKRLDRVTRRSAPQHCSPAPPNTAPEETPRCRPRDAPIDLVASDCGRWRTGTVASSTAQQPAPSSKARNFPEPITVAPAGRRHAAVHGPTSRPWRRRSRQRCHLKNPSRVIDKCPVQSTAVASISTSRSGKARRATPRSVPGGATPADCRRSAMDP